MGAPAGNQFWKIRSKHGRDKLFESPDLLWKAATEYFEWCDKNPLKEEKGFAFQGVVTTEEFNKMRAYTLTGLCLYLGCNDAYFRIFKAQLADGEQDFNTVLDKIQMVIYTQKFEGAAADLLNPVIIARDLGLKDRTDHTTDDKPIDMSAWK